MHFPDDVWADYVRALGTEESKQQLGAHLASSCPACTAAFGFWQKVTSIADQEIRFAPPDSAVRIAKRAMATMSLPRQSAWTLALLVFDSLRQPLTVGVRSGASQFRQLIFEAEGTVVDLVVDLHPQTRTISLVGQVVDKGGARVAPRQVSVISWTETGQPLAETSSNEFGEFQMEVPAQDRLRLSVEIAGNRPIRIPPINLTPDQMRPVT